MYPHGPCSQYVVVGGGEAEGGGRAAAAVGTRGTEGVAEAARNLPLNNTSYIQETKATSRRATTWMSEYRPYHSALQLYPQSIPHIAIQVPVSYTSSTATW